MVPARAIALLALAAACAQKGIGSVGEHTLEPARTVAASHAATGTDRIASLDVTLTDDPNFPCENLGRSLPAAARSLALRVFSIDGGTFVAPSAPGAYRVVEPTGTVLADGQYGYAIYVESDPLCRVFGTNEFGSHDGTITVTQLSPSVAGRFDLTLSTGDRFAGGFAAPLCAQAADGGPCR